jgi:ferredoxin
MAYVVAEPCVNCKYTDCVTVCPVECFYEAENILYIHPDECIDCGACVPECPVQAIFPADEVPAEWTHWTAINRQETVDNVGKWPKITEKKAPLGPPK